MGPSGFRLVVGGSQVVFSYWFGTPLDLQSVNITVRVLSKPQTEALPSIYSRLGVDYDERVLPSIANEVLKSTVVRSPDAPL